MTTYEAFQHLQNISHSPQTPILTEPSSLVSLGRDGLISALVRKYFARSLHFCEQ